MLLELMEKVKKEYTNYIKNIKKLSKNEIIERAGEIKMMENFNDAISSLYNYDDSLYKLLLEKNNALKFIYDRWLDADLSVDNNFDNDLFYLLDNDIDIFNNNLLKEIENDSNYNLIKNISSSLEQLDNCDNIKDKFCVSNLDLINVYNILKTKDGTNYLYYFFNDLKNNKEIKNIDNIKNNILPDLKKLYLEKNNIKPDKIKYRENER